MKRILAAVTLAPLAMAVLLTAQPAGDPVIEGFRTVEVASVSDALEQLYGTRGYMSHEMRPLFTTKFAGPAVTVMLKKEEHKEGASASLRSPDSRTSSRKPKATASSRESSAATPAPSFSSATNWATWPCPTARPSSSSKSSPSATSAPA